MKNDESKEGEFPGLKIVEELRLKPREEKEVEIDKKSLVVGVLGDFSGSSATSATMGGEKFKVIDRDNFDEIMAALAPRCDVEVANFIKENRAPFQLSLIFHELNDFHPDHLIHKVPVVEKLFEARSAVGEPDRLAKILREVGVSIAAEEPSPVEEQGPEPETPDEVSRKPLKPGLPPSQCTKIGLTFRAAI